MSHSIMLKMNPGLFRSTRRIASLLTRRWIVLFAGLFGIFIGLPLLAPVFMDWGWLNAGKMIYLVYSFLCHQLPERSYFLFGPKVTYSLSEIQSTWQNSSNPMILRQFIGNTQMGWKVAWSDRMVSMYTSSLFFGLLWYPFRDRIKKLPWWGLFLLLIPMGIDGTSHLISDLAGIGQGFRYTNTWLVTLTNHSFPITFYVGDALGSFNSWMRIMTGVFFGIGVVGFSFPYFEDAFSART